MRHPQVVVYESDGWIAGQLEQLAAEHRWLLRESRQPEACLSLVRQARPSVLLLKLERQLVAELTLLSQVAEHAPDCPVIVVSDVKLESAEHRTSLAGLAYDLGARYVLFPPLERPLLEDVTAGLLGSAIRATSPAVAEGGGDA
jgi:DNA-binding NtrC family response regulator